jgi:hypothetical protein
VIAAYLRRGLAAGLLAGAFAFGEPLQELWAMLGACFGALCALSPSGRSTGRGRSER